MDIYKLNIKELSAQEKLTTTGGDGFAEDVGWLLGNLIEIGFKATPNISDDLSLIMWANS